MYENITKYIEIFGNDAADDGKLQADLAAFTDAFQQAGLMDPALKGKRLRRLVLLLMTSHQGWAQHNATWDPAHRISLEEMLACQWAALLPYLTEAGRAQWAALAAEEQTGEE